MVRFVAELQGRTRVRRRENHPWGVHCHPCWVSHPEDASRKSLNSSFYRTPDVRLSSFPSPVEERGQGFEDHFPRRFFTAAPTFKLPKEEGFDEVGEGGGGGGR